MEASDLPWNNSYIIYITIMFNIHISIYLYVGDLANCHGKKRTKTTTTTQGQIHQGQVHTCIQIMLN